MSAKRFRITVTMSFVSCRTGSPGLRCQSRTQVRAATGHATTVGNREIVVVDEERHAGRHLADERDRLLVDPLKNAEFVVEGGGDVVVGRMRPAAIGLEPIPEPVIAANVVATAGEQDAAPPRTIRGAGRELVLEVPREHLAEHAPRSRDVLEVGVLRADPGSS
jgi:hypothetical protein